MLEQRGTINREASATSVPVDLALQTNLFKDDLLLRHPQVGAILAASSDREAHEWSQLASGVFTYELVSALAGAADVNGDREIAYSEVAAFLSSANREIRDPRAALDVVSRPPQIDRNTPIMAFNWLSGPATLEGVPVNLGHFYLETEEGQRLLDAHPEANTSMVLLLPPDAQLWLRSGVREAFFESAPGRAVRFETLQLQTTDRLASRGGVTSALRKGFFALPFGAAYYLGYVDKTGELGVPFRDVSKAVQTRLVPESHTPSILCITGAGLALISTVLFSSMAVNAKHEYDSTDLQQPALDAWERMNRYRAVAIGSGAASVGLAVSAWLLWPNKPWSLTPELISQDGVGLRLSLSF